MIQDLKYLLSRTKYLTSCLLFTIYISLKKKKEMFQDSYKPNEEEKQMKNNLVQIQK